MSGWSDALIAFQTPGLPVEVQVAAAQGLRELDNYMRETITEKAVTPDEGLISALVAGRAAGENDLSEDELVADVAVVFFAGHETTINTIANALRSLLERREYWEAITAGTMDTDNLVDELFCVGSLLARLQLREAVTRVAKRFPEMRLVTDVIPEIPHHGLRAPLTLLVLLK